MRVSKSSDHWCAFGKMSNFEKRSLRSGHLMRPGHVTFGVIGSSFFRKCVKLLAEQLSQINLFGIGGQLFTFIWKLYEEKNGCKVFIFVLIIWNKSLFSGKMITYVKIERISLNLLAIWSKHKTELRINYDGRKVEQSLLSTQVSKTSITPQQEKKH